jgi:hypothetical protein
MWMVGGIVREAGRSPFCFRLGCMAYYVLFGIWLWGWRSLNFVMKVIIFCVAFPVCLPVHSAMDLLLTAVFTNDFLIEAKHTKSFSHPSSFLPGKPILEHRGSNRLQYMFRRRRWTVPLVAEKLLLRNKHRQDLTDGYQLLSYGAQKVNRRSCWRGVP